ncbi:hypothetical protein L1987_85416 [Smallanthus sonchifolius]|uniref:Uncharacterized protein n=1 Tax=Smallanthus sonchifolius TaxID=185202 RepID=A0ACB8XXP2_9ASTR|nr:hypothetical protein L1987_85416 [Smallanthus sonchifolius]
MDPHSFIARAEAQRWLGIAEKLLISHDLVGSKTFAIRARESDPRLEAADQILAIADTLLAAEKQVVGNNGAHQPDYYAILQLVRFVQDTEHIASQYRRLAVMLNPHQNRYPYADQAFQLVNDAWAVLSNPMRKSMYDSDLDYPPQQQMNTIGFNLEQQHHQQQQPHNFFSINHMGAGHEQELPEQQQSFQSRLHQSHHQQQQHQHQQLQQHNFLSQPNPVRPLPVREQEHMFQHREQEQLFQPQVQPFQVTSPPHQQTRPSPQPPQQQSHIQSPPATPQSPFSWPQAPQLSQPQQLQHQQVKQEKQHQLLVKQEQHLKHEQQIKQEQLKQHQLKQEQLKQQQLQQEQLKQQQLQQEQLKQQQLQEEQRKQQQLQQEQLKQQQLQQEQLKQQQLLEEQRKQKQLLEEQRKQQQLQEEQRKQQQLMEEQRKQQQIQEEQRKQQQLQEEQRKQQQLQEEQRKQQQLQEEQRKQQQLQEEQRKQQQLQKEQLKQQQQEAAKQNAAPVQLPSQVNSNNGVREEETETETEAETEVVDDSPTFWTACPYCFYMYEYPRVYAECTLRCDNCKRAFQAVRISSPPPIIEGQDAYFYCWGFFPLGLSMSHLQKNNNKGTNSNWTPFSSLHNASNNSQNHLNEQAAPKKNPFVNKSSGPRIYVDDITDDMFIGVSEPSSNSDTEWVGTKKQKAKRMDKGFKERIQVLALRAMYTGKGSVKNLKHGIPAQGVEVPTVLVVETSKRNAGSNPRKQSGLVAQELGKLDLNVEFNNNEGEETAARMPAGTRRERAHEQEEEESIEGIEFFEGLDEYLSSLPILSVVNEEKVKVA